MGITLGLLLAGFVFFSLFTFFHGVYLSFKKSWAIGAVSLLIPAFANIVSLSKLVFNKDILS